MVTISLCMIVKNEEDVLERCLSSVQSLVDEIIIVDTGSTDKTKDIAVKFTDHVYDFVWNDDFAAARNISFEKATMNYCMWLDADDVILEKDQAELKAVKAKMTGSEDIVMLPYHTAFDEKGNPTFIYYRERIVKNCGRFLWEGEVHETITPSGQVRYENAAVTHKKMKLGNPDRNLRILEKKKNSGTPLSPRQKFYYGQELYFHQQYENARLALEDFLDDDGGWLENKLEACGLIANCYNQMGNPEQAAKILAESLLLDMPRAELCCQLGEYFLKKEKFLQASFWYEVARNRTPNPKSGGFVRMEYYGYIPNIQLAVCYDRLGQWEKAKMFNECAAVFKPDSEAVKQNRIYFENKLKEIKGESINEL